VIFFTHILARPHFCKITSGEKHFVIVCAGYNNKNWYRWNLDSLMHQKYSNYHIIYIDDASSDGTADLVQQYIKKNKAESRIKLIRNMERRGALENHYRTIHECADEDIIINVDADDALAGDWVLSYMNQVYSDPNIWLTYGQFVFYPEGNMGYCRSIAQEEFERDRRWCHFATHMRTFYAGLYKKIDRKDLVNRDGSFFKVTCDKATMTPMMEMAYPRFMFIPEVVYLYNNINTLSDARLYGDQQVAVAEMIYAKERYQPLSGPLPY
jgi:glycosyltransferase involved in cell wall biosynthesis